MIKSLSPYYLTIPWVAPISEEICTSYTLQIFVWNGLKNIPPTNPSYEITKDNVTNSNASDKINISPLINDFIDFTPFDTTTTELINGFNQYWVKTQIFYTTSNEFDFIPNFQNVALMLAGYGYGMSGENSQPPSNRILLSGTEFKVDRNGYFVFPFLINEPTPAEPSLIIDDVNEVVEDEYEIIYTTNLDITNLITYYRVNGTIDWDVYIGVPPFESPFSFIPFTPLSGGNYDFMISTFDSFTNETVYSNIFNLVL